MQTFERALIERVLDGSVERDVAADASSNRHDFLVALEYSLKRQAVGVSEEEERAPQQAPPQEAEPMPELRIVSPAEG
jgi:hypothetical protein